MVLRYFCPIPRRLTTLVRRPTLPHSASGLSHDGERDRLPRRCAWGCLSAHTSSPNPLRMALRRGQCGLHLPEERTRVRTVGDPLRPPGSAPCCPRCARHGAPAIRASLRTRAASRYGGAPNRRSIGRRRRVAACAGRTVLCSGPRNHRWPNRSNTARYRPRSPAACRAATFARPADTSRRFTSWNDFEP